MTGLLLLHIFIVKYTALHYGFFFIKDNCRMTGNNIDKLFL